MKKIFVYTILSLILSWNVYAQRPSAGNMPRMAIGQIYGKILDAQTGKPIEYATVTVLNPKDSSVVNGMLTRANGDFNIDHLPFGKFILKINFLGYQPLFRDVAITPSNAQQDLGNFRLSPAAQVLQGVSVTAQQPQYTMGIDKKVFNVEKSLTTVGGTATDVLRQVPSVNVDIDGNVTVRNATPQIFVDGKPTALTLDQIPADAIESIEVITNPSAKYDASGQGGIINIILKKNKKAGINGMIRLGAGTGDKYNAGADLAIRQNPINFYMNYNYFQNNETYTGTNTTQLLSSGDHNAYSNTLQYTDGKNDRAFQFGRFGLDYYLDNRNTISFEQSFFGGHFSNPETLTTSYLNDQKDLLSSSIRNNLDKRNFRGIRSQLSYSHNFIKKDETFSAFFNYHVFHNDGSGNNFTNFYDSAGDFQSSGEQRNNTNGKSTFVVSQADYANPIGEHGKLEAGLKSTIRNFSSVYNVYDIINNFPKFNDSLSNDYKYLESVSAAYVSFSNQVNQFGYQIGLRAEQSHYKGTLTSRDVSYTNDYLSLFPSIYLTQKFGQHQELQLNYSRRIDRPNFWQLIPYIDYSNPQNQRKGNPDLKPEFINSFELNYNNQFNKGNFLLSAYFRNSHHDITSVYVPLNGDTLLTTFANANSTNTYGLELTLQNDITRWWSLTTNLNFYNTEIKAGNIQGDLAKQGYQISTNLNNNGFSWFAKVNSNMQLPKNFAIQLTGNYQAPLPTPQGKTLAFGNVDFALRKDFLKNRAASLTLSVSDIFNTRKFETQLTRGLVVQDNIRHPESRILRVNFMYRFGKMDMQLFRKKQNNQQQDNSIQEELGPSGVPR
ncbi:MAG: TonB-dependent receptor [Thermoflavifilum sp.]|nr:TonB-dependent receptor [Thermoflavifilum sp.]